MKRVSTFLLYAAAATLFQIATAPNASAAPILGSDLATFAVLGSSTVTNTNPATNLPNGPTTITGNVGDWATPTGANAVTGLAATQVSGTIYQGAALATSIQALAQEQLAIAMGLLAGLATNGTILGGILDNQILAQGVYAVSAAPSAGGFNLLTNGVLTLDAQGQNNPFWVFQMSSSLIMGSSSVVQFSNPGSTFNPGVFWVLPGSSGSATLGTDSLFQGNILAEISVGLDTRAIIQCGSALANTGAVTLDTNKISTGCNGSLSVSNIGGIPVVIGPPGPGGTGGTPLPVPEPGTLVLLGPGIACLVARRLRSARGQQPDLAPKA